MVDPVEPVARPADDTTEDAFADLGTATEIPPDEVVDKVDGPSDPTLDDRERESEEPADPEAIAARLRLLANEEVDEGEFFDRWLTLLVQHPAFAAGTVWTLNANGLLGVLCSTGDEHAGEPTGDPRSQHIRVERVLETLRAGESRIHSANEDACLVVPVRRGEHVGGAVELALAEHADTTHESLREWVESAAVQASAYIRWRSTEGTPEAEAAFWTRARRTTLALHGSRTVAEIGTTICGDGPTLLDCERMTFAVRRGPRAEVVAVTGLGRVNPRSNRVRALARLATLAVRTGRSIAYDGEELPDLPAEGRDALMHVLDETDIGALLVVPLFDNPAGDGPAGARRRRTVGAIVVERTDTCTPPVRRRIDGLADHSGTAVARALEDERTLFRRTRRAVGSALAALRGRRLLVLALVLLLLVGTGLALGLVPWSHRVEGRGRLLPVVQRDVFAPATGRVAKVFVRTGEWIEAGSPLLLLNDDERDMEWLTLRTELEEKVESERSIEAELDDPRTAADRSRDESIRLRGQLGQLRAEIAGLERRVALVEAERRSLRVVAPISGTVTTPELPGSLDRRPIQRGEALVELMNDHEAWRLEIEIPEDQLGHVIAARRSAGEEGLSVTFVMATRPEERFEGRLVSIAERTGLSSEYGASARAIVDIDVADLPERRIGTAVTARIACGKQPLGYVLFGDFVDSVRRWWW